MRRWSVVGLLWLSVWGTSACGGREAADAPDTSAATQNTEKGTPAPGRPERSSEVTLNREPPLPLVPRLMLGTMRLEQGEHAVTAAAAAKLLPLWQKIQRGNLEEEERGAVLRQIESAMEPARMEAIGAMRLAYPDLQAWAESKGIELPQGFGQPGPLASLSEEERKKLRAETEGMTPEQRTARLRELGIGNPGRRQGQGGPDGQNPGAGRGGGRARVIEPLIDLLTKRAAGGRG